MKLTAYDTTAGRLIANMDKLEASLRAWFVKTNGYLNNDFTRPIGKNHCCFLTGADSESQDVPLFIHPVLIDYKGENYLCSDMRLYYSHSKENSIPQIRNTTEYNFAKSKAILGLLWMSGKESELKNGLKFAADVFSSWLSETISKNYALDPGDQLTLRILLHFYYHNLFHVGEIIDEQTRQNWAIHTIKATHSDSKTVFSVFDQLEKMENIDSLCNAAKRVVKSVALGSLNVAVLLTLIRSAWFGNQAKENLSVALEHPPTWCAIVFSCVTEKTYKNSTVYKYVEKLGKKKADEEFMNTYTRLILEYTDKPQADPFSRLGAFE